MLPHVLIIPVLSATVAKTSAVYSAVHALTARWRDIRFIAEIGSKRMTRIIILYCRKRSVVASCVDKMH